MNKIYFPNLNGLRFFAALFVIIHHIEQFKQILGLKNYMNENYIKVLGQAGVILFFVLSGFLITYLLLVEKNKTKTIIVKSFYIRRALRIWPLYYFIVFLGFFVFPNIPALEIPLWSKQISNYLGINFLLFMFFLPNYAIMLYSPMPYISQTWSVGLEEQFYIVWPVLIKKVKNIKALLLIIILFYTTVKISVYILIDILILKNNIILGMRVFFESLFTIDYMAIGGLFAYYLFENSKVLNLFYNKIMQIIVLVLLFLFFFSGIYLPIISLHKESCAILFGLLILNLAANSKSIINLEYDIFNYLGKISFGLYIFHPIAIITTLKLLNHINIKSLFLTYFFSIGLSIVLASLSYKYLENYFIKKKVLF